MAVKMSLKIEGLDRFKKALVQYPNISGKHIQKAMKKSILSIQEKTAPITPIDKGNLRKAVRRGGKVVGLKGVIDVDTRKIIGGYNYAPIQHESLHFRHNVGQAKFLEKGAERAINIVREIFRDELDGTINEIARMS